MMIDTKLKIRNISKNLSSLEAASRIIVQYQSGLSGQRVFYIDMSEHQAGKKRFEISDLRELPVWYKNLKCKDLSLRLYFQLT